MGRNNRSAESAGSSVKQDDPDSRARKRVAAEVGGRRIGRRQVSLPRSFSLPAPARPRDEREHRSASQSLDGRFVGPMEPPRDRPGLCPYRSARRRARSPARPRSSCRPGSARRPPSARSGSRARSANGMSSEPISRRTSWRVMSGQDLVALGRALEPSLPDPEQRRVRRLGHEARARRPGPPRKPRRGGRPRWPARWPAGWST